MPIVANTSKTWALGTHTIYNYQQGGDRGMRWFGTKTDKRGTLVRANLLFVDLHAEGSVPVPEGVQNETEEYRFAP
jgi:prepilin-type processing-associated H-X9-DG protein